MTLPPPAVRTHRLQLQISERRVLLMLGDTLAILLAVLLSLVIWLIMDGRHLGVSFLAAHSYWFPILAGLWWLLASANDFYNLRISSRLDQSMMRLVQVELQVLVVYLVIFFLSPRTALPRLFILYYGLLSFAFILAWRLWRPFLIGWTATPRRALIVGTGHTAHTINATLREEAPDDYRVVGLIRDKEGSSRGHPLPVLGSGASLLAIAQAHGVSEVILANNGQDLSDEMFQALMDCYEAGLSIVPMPLLYEQVTGRVPIEHIGPNHWTSILPVEGTSIFDPYPTVKRLGDLTLAVIGLALFIVLLPFIALAMSLDSPGPLFFAQPRVGQGGKIFRVLKLRSMIPDAERDTGPQWASDGDPRITRTGKFLRKTRLDEVPQLVNVLRGEMSLIGPRPERPEFIADLSRTIPFYRTRHTVRPGITGWAQVRYGYASSEDDALVKLQYDLYYIRHQSLALDVLILLRTAGKMLSLQGR